MVLMSLLRRDFVLAAGVPDHSGKRQNGLVCDQLLASEARMCQAEPEGEREFVSPNWYGFGPTRY